MCVCVCVCVCARTYIEMCAFPRMLPAPGPSSFLHTPPPPFPFSVSRALFRTPAALLCSWPFAASSPRFRPLGLALQPFPSAWPEISGCPAFLPLSPASAFAPSCALPSSLPFPLCWLVLDAVSLFLPRTLLLPLPDPQLRLSGQDKSSAWVSRLPFSVLTPFPTHHFCPFLLCLLSLLLLDSTSMQISFCAPPHYYSPPPVSPSFLCPQYVFPSPVLGRPCF